jgi:hypothetical protein
MVPFFGLLEPKYSSRAPVLAPVFECSFKTVNVWLCRAKYRLLAPRRVWGHSGETALDWSSLTWAGPALAVVVVELFPQQERLEGVAGAFERGEILVRG